MNLGAGAVTPKLFATASQDSPAFKRCRICPRCSGEFHAALLLPGATTSVRTASRGFCCGHLVVGGAQHHAAALFDFNDGTSSAPSSTSWLKVHR